MSDTPHQVDHVPFALSFEDVVAGHVTPEDLRISPAQLRHQANVARDHANPQLAENLERAAELSALSDADLLLFYEALRPRRSSVDELRALAARLDVEAGPLSANLVREALHHCERRGMLRPTSASP